jgi:hypothetical protein
LPVGGIHEPKSVARGSISHTRRPKHIECSHCTQRQLIWWRILKELIDVISYFTDRVRDRTLNFYDLSGCYIIQRRHL